MSLFAIALCEHSAQERPWLIPRSSWAENGRLGVKVKKRGGDEEVMAFKPENIAKVSRSEGDASADEGPGPRELRVLDKGDAMNSFANVLYSIKEKFGERASDAREIVVRMARPLDEHKGHASLAVQQDDELAGVLLHPMPHAAEAPGSGRRTAEDLRRRSATRAPRARCS